MTALPPVTVTVGATTVTSVAVDSVTITHGRQAVGQDMAPATCQLRFLRQSVTWAMAIGDAVDVSYGSGAPAYRFRGHVTSVAWSDLFVDVIATSRAFGMLARTRLVDYVVNESNATPTIGAALNYAVYTATLGLPDAPPPPYSFSTGYVTLMPDIDMGTSSGLDVAQQIASWDVYGLLYETTEGEFGYTSYRTETTAAWSVPASAVFRDWSVAYDLSGMGNIQSVVYNGDQSRTVRDSDSVNTYGSFQQSRTMQVIDAADAVTGAYASLLAAGTPWPIITGVGFDLSALPSLAAQNQVLASQVSTVVDTSAAAAYIPGLPSKCCVEGWTEVITRHTWAIRYNLSNYLQTLRPETWAEVTPTLAWSAVSPSLTWRDLISGSL